MFNKFVSKSFNSDNYSIEPIQGDASLRLYYRLNHKGQNYILMACPPKYSSVEVFHKISDYLLDNDFRAPKIYFSDYENGFLILEDFGEVSVKHQLYKYSENEDNILSTYYVLIDILIKLYNLDNLPSYIAEFTKEKLLSELEVFVNYYVKYTYSRDLSINELDEFYNIWSEILDKQQIKDKFLLLKDYHVENLMFINPDRDYLINNIGQVGLLDFQDALIGSPIYDLVSLLEDARFEVKRAIVLKLIKYYCDKTEYNYDKVMNDYHILGAQRNMRILGVFVRKYLRDGKDSYLRFLPRVKQYLEYDLSHKTMAKLKLWFEKLK